ncbi:MAG: response regulator transcription factor [Candidatus Eremiobacteraeota bacterium]|nr:response regulator transcription factor [Candidatus Eremiobacteraeota bacterium]
MPQARVLVIESNPATGRLERKTLETAGHAVQTARSGAEGIELACSLQPDVVVLDGGLTDIPGLDVCSAVTNATPAFVLLVSTRSRRQDVLRALERGADDCITRPFAGRELVARVASLLRRRDKVARRARAGNRLEIGVSHLDRDFLTLSTNGSRVVLTALEFRLMWFLGEAEGRLVTRAQILESVWNDTSGVPTRVVDVHVAALRKKLVTIHAPLHIASVRGIGYRLDTGLP